MNHSQIPNQIRELMDVCSSQQMLADDANMEPLRDWMNENPAGMDLWQRLRDFDATIEKTFVTVEIPSGLSDRIRDRIRSATQDNNNHDTDNQERGKSVDRINPAYAMDEELDRQLAAFELEKQPSLISKPSPVQQDESIEKKVDSSNPLVAAPQMFSKKKFSKKKIQKWSIGLVTALSLALIGYGVMHWLGIFDSNVNRLADGHPSDVEAIAWVRNIPAHWNRDLESAPTTDYPTSNDLTVDPVAWQPFETKYDPDAIVYDYTPSGQENTYLFVLNVADKGDLRTSLPTSPRYEASNYSVGQSHDENNHLYVLVVMGNANTYRKRVKPSIGIVYNDSKGSSWVDVSPQMLGVLGDIDNWLNARHPR